MDGAENLSIETGARLARCLDLPPNAPPVAVAQVVGQDEEEVRPGTVPPLERSVPAPFAGQNQARRQRGDGWKEGRGKSACRTA